MVDSRRLMSFFSLDADEVLGLLGLQQRRSMEAQLLAGIGSFLGANVLPVIWGCAEQYLFHRFYEGKRAEARLENRVSWWEKGKASRW